MSFAANYDPVLRPDDGERVGYLARVAGGWQALSLIGFPLGEPADRASAVELARRLGLAALDGNWWCRAPRPFPRTDVDLRTVGDDWPWRRVVVIEVTASTCAIRPALAWPEESSTVVTLALPVDDVLRDSPPPDAESS